MFNTALASWREQHHCSISPILHYLQSESPVFSDGKLRTFISQLPMPRVFIIIEGMKLDHSGGGANVLARILIFSLQNRCY